MNQLNIDQSQIEAFLLIFIRVGAILMTLPIFGSESLSRRIKIGLVFAVSLTLFPVVDLSGINFPLGTLTLIPAIVGEIIIGAILGLTARLIFAGVQLSGQLVGFQMGFAIARVIDPVTGIQASILSTFENIVAVLIFLSINAHHFFFKAISSSFQLIPPFGLSLSGNLMELILNLSENMFILAIKIGAPVIATLLFTNVAFGIIARTVPQVHIMIVAFPLQISIGLLFIGLSFPFFSFLLSKEFLGLEKSIMQILRFM